MDVEVYIEKERNLHKRARNLKGRDVDGRIILQMDLTETDRYQSQALLNMVLTLQLTSSGIRNFSRILLHEVNQAAIVPAVDPYSLCPY